VEYPSAFFILTACEQIKYLNRTFGAYETSWMKGHHWCDFEFDKDYFPDAENFIKRLHQRGLKVCVWVSFENLEFRMVTDHLDADKFLYCPRITII
jgi:alpha-glucosidase (family GH31 glycosyl hydrolase)